jgi:3-mercaptopyruvate sulfurtransferase SseA
MRKLVLLLAMAVAVAAGAQMKPNPVQITGPGPKLAPVAQQPLESAKRIKRDDAIRLVKLHKAVFVDVRSKESYDAGHIKGSISIPESQLLTRLKEIPAGRMIITYCA